ncbi:heterokaryon incompatibility protein-domain-containing protein [Annulohypoxylon maeteangense]|uniref:heterokaryon incompatibility protein-domain-containing protein n=1 Tax=Annulohypoxylon maeteangense TaxID=1927788 RepID=UPI002007D200|nr:heterokaryon incompatibility protein-domain-containing protein [Annulohypoxylon maeteangense]KAI0888978.1 heterokaryon incompatibility protein-domain-containing protein [Annulohypoxylon maeteangense]
MHLRDLCGCLGRRSHSSSVAPLATSQYSTLCDRCKALELDDVTIGGFASSSEDGQKYLKLDEDDRYKDIEIDYYRHDIYPALLNIRKSASEGCDFCALLRDSILSPEFKAALVKDEVDISAAFYISIKLNYRWRADNLPDNYECKRGLASLEARLTIEYEERIDCSYTFRFAIESTPLLHSNGRNSDSSLTTQGLCEKWLRLRLNRTGYVLSKERVAWLKGEVDRFTEEYNPPPQPSFIPTRLIQVDCDVARLVQKDDILESRVGPVRYAALSYCWGNKEEALSQYKTTKSTLVARLSGFEAHKMSEVLCDAIQTARALSLPYIWVDALCIIQDDIEDWERESIQMGRIYENAHVTFFTLSSNSCTQGFLERQPPRLRIPFRSKINPPVEGAYGVRLQRIDSNWSVGTVTVDSYIEKDLELSNWGTRGWTYQEQALSKACIWFGTSRIHFLCPEWSFTEGDATQSRALPHFQLDHINIPDQNADSLCWSWYANIVEQFTERLFTNPTDCFPALSGLAQNFHKTLGGEYLAGIWTADLHKGLWFSCVKHPTSSFPVLLEQLMRPEVYVAPTWSWASRQGVTYHSRNPIHRIDLYLHFYMKNIRKAYRKIESDMKLMGFDQFGRLKSGSLRVTSRTYDLQISPNRVRKPQYFEDGELVVDSENRTIVRCECDWAGSLTDVGNHVVLLLLGHTPDDLLLPSTEASEPGDDDEIPENRLAYGLLIYNAPKSENFYRIGIFLSRSKDGYGTALFRGCEEREIVLI